VCGGHAPSVLPPKKLTACRLIPAKAGALLSLSVFPKNTPKRIPQKITIRLFSENPSRSAANGRKVAPGIPVMKTIYRVMKAVYGVMNAGDGLNENCLWSDESRQWNNKNCLWSDERRGRDK
jgi:hypothetical protein